MTDAARQKSSSESARFLDEIRSTFSSRAGEPAILWQNSSLTYGELDRKARCWAASLQDAGVAPGDRVAITTPAIRSGFNVYPQTDQTPIS